jgi:RHS repeat-associated protein
VEEKAMFNNHRSYSMQTALIQPFRMLKRCWILVVVVAWLFGANASTVKGQTYLQNIAPQLSTPVPVENGYVDASKGQLHLDFPMGTFQRRAGHFNSFSEIYNSNVWAISGSTWQPNNGGWQMMNSAAGMTNYTWKDASSCAEGGGARWVVFSNWTFTGPDGIVRYFPASTKQALYPDFCAGDTPNGSGYANDASGYYIVISNYTCSVVYAPDGTMYSDGGCSGGNVYAEDSNGNFLGGNFTPVISGNQTTYNFPNAQGTTSAYVFTTATINLKTNFGQAQLTECSGPTCTLSVIQSIKLPDSTLYSFKYDCDSSVNSAVCSSPTGQSAYYGLLTSMTLPTGGAITYSWQPFTDAQGNHYQWIRKRVTPDSSIGWAYTPLVINTCGSGQVNCQETFKVTKPNNDTAAYTFTLNGGVWNSESQFSDSSGTLLSTETMCYTFVTVTSGACSYSVTTASPATNVSLDWKTSTFPLSGGTNLNTTVNYTTDPNFGNIQKTVEWNYYTGTLPTTPDRTVTIVYLNTSAYLNANIVDLPTTVNVTGKSGLVASTTYGYDAGAIGSAPNMSNHDDANFGTGNTVRGDVTSVKRWITGSSSLTTNKAYDMTGQVVTSWDSNGNMTTYSYTDNFYTDPGDGMAPTTKSVSPATNTYLTQITYPTVNSVTLKKQFGYYWGTGQAAITTDPNTTTTTFHFFDSLNRPTSAALPNNGWNLLTYNSTDTQLDAYTGTTSTTASTSCTACRHDQTVFDALGRVISDRLINDPDGETFRDTAYDSNGRVASVSNPYRSTSDPTYGLETPSYDSLGHVTNVKHADNNVAHTYYGANVGTGGGAISQLCTPASTYGLGYPMLIVDEVGNKRQTWTDAFGRVIETDEPDSGGNLTVGTCSTYDANNNLLQVTSLGLTQTQKPTYTYDELSRVTSKTLAESGVTNFYYTTIGGGLCSGNPSAVCRRTDARSITTTFTYDALNRLVGKTYSDSTHAVSYFYDQTSYNGLTITNGKGRRTGMSDSSGQTAWSFDAMGNVLSEERTINGQTKTVNYTYNLDGSIATITYPGGRKVTYTEGNAQRMTQAVDSTDNINYATAPVSPTVMYAPQGRPQNLIFGKTGTFAGITEARTYNNRLEITGIEATSSVATPLNLSYSYVSGNNGNIGQQTNNATSGRTQNYTYDSLNRLLTAQTQAASGGDCWGQSFGNNGPPPTLAADALANLFYTSATKCSAPAPQFTMNTSNNNHFTGTGIGYDPAGDMTQDTAYTYSYDAENHIITASGMTNGPYCYTYDGNGLRVMKTHASGGSCTGTVTVDVLYWRAISGDSLAETDGSGSTTNASYSEYIFFAERRVAQSNPSSGNVYYYFVDQLSSTRVVTTAAGTPCYEVDYLPYGTENTPAGFTNTCSSRYRFTGYERDLETAAGTSAGNDYAFARYYNSRLGRFMSADPLNGQAADPQTLNHYSYVRDNPINLVDPSGMCDTDTDFHVYVCIDTFGLGGGDGGGGGDLPLNCQFSPACLAGWRANINKGGKPAPPPRQARKNVETSCTAQRVASAIKGLINFGVAGTKIAGAVALAASSAADGPLGAFGAAYLAYGASGNLTAGFLQLTGAITGRTRVMGDAATTATTVTTVFGMGAMIATRGNMEVAKGWATAESLGTSGLQGGMTGSLVDQGLSTSGKLFQAADLAQTGADAAGVNTDGSCH